MAFAAFPTMRLTVDSNQMIGRSMSRAPDRRPDSEG
jgi:hypothetical protein